MQYLQCKKIEMKLKNNATLDEKIIYYFNKFNCELNEETVKCFKYFIQSSEKKTLNYKSFFEILKTMMTTEYPLKLSERYIKFKNINKQIRSLEKYQLRYGIDEGTERFNSYCKKQGESNTFEYKHKKYGWDEDDFAKYNKSRAITLENMIKKYGKEEGRKKYNDYCKKQSYVGCKKEYFIEKYGKEEGLERYVSMLEKKMRPVIDLLGRSVSNIELQVISALSNDNCVFCSNNVMKDDEIKLSFQYKVYDKENNTFYIYDGCLLDKKIFVEFNGDLWHNNIRNNHVQKLMEKDGEIAQQIKDRPQHDIKKIECANRIGFDVYTIWEMDWQNHSKEIVEHFHNWVDNHNGNYSTGDEYCNENS